MDTWLDTVCQIVASDTGTPVRRVKYAMRDFAYECHVAYNSGYTAEQFAYEIVSTFAANQICY